MTYDSSTLFNPLFFENISEKCIEYLSLLMMNTYTRHFTASTASPLSNTTETLKDVQKTRKARKEKEVRKRWEP